MSQNLLQKSIEKDNKWAIERGLPDKEKRMPLLGSWSCFQKEATIENMLKSKINYLSATLKNSEFSVCEIYLHFSVDSIKF